MFVGYIYLVVGLLFGFGGIIAGFLSLIKKKKRYAIISICLFLSGVVIAFLPDKDEIRDSFRPALVASEVSGVYVFDNTRSTSLEYYVPNPADSCILKFDENGTFIIPSCPLLLHYLGDTTHSPFAGEGAWTIDAGNVISLKYSDRFISFRARKIEEAVYLFFGVDPPFCNDDCKVVFKKQE